jgi:protein SCO1/2
MLCLIVRTTHAAPHETIAPADSTGFDSEAALAASQAAIGRRIGDYAFRDTLNRPVHLSDYRGKPLIISLIYTSCYHICPMTTQHLARAVQAGRQALGADSFNVVSIGFNTPHDTPDTMAAFARKQGVDLPNWTFLSADAETMAALVEALGFLYRTSPKGYDHLIQASLLDGDGIVYRQVYGELFEVPWLVEPLKQLVYGTHESDSALESLVKKVRLFCTTYDPATGGYRIDYSLFIGMFIGGGIIAIAAGYLIREMRRGRSKDIAAS